MTIAVIDYGMGNLRSVVNAFGSIGAKVAIARSPEDLLTSEAIVLPGVGAFKDGMTRLDSGGWTQALHHHVIDQEKPFLGLCLGMQLMAAQGSEHGDAQGLGWIAGEVVRLEGDASLKIPHVGWNDVRLVGPSRLFRDVGDRETFYFLHSYHLRPIEEHAVVATCTYGNEFVAAVESRNLFGAQFHPEKSQRSGLRILHNFASDVAE